MSAASYAQDHIHLPSVHIRRQNGDGFDYEEDLYINGRGRRRRVERFVRLVVIQDGERTLVRETFDELCQEEIARFQADLPVLMDEENPANAPIMQERARNEFARQIRVARGEERACARCGCSETRSCSGGCIWATQALCSRCI